MMSAPAASSEINVLRFTPPQLLAELLRRQRTLTLFAGGMLLLALPTLLLMVVDERTVRDVGIWAKPLKFQLSTALFAATTAWFMGLLPEAMRQARSSQVMIWTLIGTSLFEVGYISLQAALGSSSHYNVGDPFHALMFGLMAFAAVLLTATQGFLAWQIHRHHRVHREPVKGSAVVGSAVAVNAVVYGLLLTFALSTISGFVLGGKQPPPGVGLPLLGWHLTGGDARPAHFLAVHAQQILPIAGYLLQRYLAAVARPALVLTILAYLATWFWLVGIGLMQPAAPL